MPDNVNERDMRPITEECAEAEEIARILPKLPNAARQRILGAVKYAEMVEGIGEQAS